MDQHSYVTKAELQACLDQLVRQQDVEATIKVMIAVFVVLATQLSMVPGQLTPGQLAEFFRTVGLDRFLRQQGVEPGDDRQGRFDVALFRCISDTLDGTQPAPTSVKLSVIKGGKE